MQRAALLLEHTARRLARYEIHFGAGPLLAAVSGGRDSTVLAWLLAELHRTGRLPAAVVLAHVDHAVHPASRTAAAGVAALATRLGCAFLGHRLAGVPAREEALRDARYAALADLAATAGAAVVLTAHHADDDLETVLFRLLRGTGPRGLAGIPEFRVLAPGLAVLRPLLHRRAAELHALLDALGLPFCADPTNLDRRFARNRLRHESLPDLRASVGPDLDASLLTLARQARTITDIVAARAHRLLHECARFANDWRATLDHPPVADADLIFLREALSMIHQRLDPRGRRSRFRWTERALDLLRHGCGRRLCGGRGDGGSGSGGGSAGGGSAGGGRGVAVERTRTGLLFCVMDRAGAPPPAPVELPGAGGRRYGTTEWHIRVTPHAEPPLDPAPGPAAAAGAGPGPVGHAVLDPRGAPRPWRLRGRRPGDRFFPLGAPGPVDLRRFLQSRHLPRFDRDRLPLVVDAADRILWVPGVEIAHPNRVRLDTGECVAMDVAIVGGDPAGRTPY